MNALWWQQLLPLAPAPASRSWRARLPEGSRLPVKAPSGLTHARKLYAPETWLQPSWRAILAFAAPVAGRQHDPGPQHRPLLAGARGRNLAARAHAFAVAAAQHTACRVPSPRMCEEAQAGQQAQLPPGRLIAGQHVTRRTR